ncbi:MAG: hypothetical protein NTY02_11400, partial [Acidobacteria bacterium]|nr:hypothetical protein [Acidobacteriota bacterium]
MTHKHNERGLSLVEATIILLSLMVLTGVLAPGVRDYVNDARDVKVKEDCEAIGVSVARLLRDVGPCVRMDGRLPCVIQNRADLLISEGGEVEGYTGYAGSTFTASSSQSVSSGGGGGIVRSSYEVADDADTVSTHEVVESVTRPPAAGARWTSMTHFGGRTAFAASLTSATDLRRTFEPIGVADDVRSVLRDGGLGLASEDVVAALARPPAPAGDRLPSCAEATPPDDAVVECEIQPGTTFEWMAYRPGAATGNSKPARLLYPRWDGKSPARAAVFRVTAGDEAYTFVVPYPCANLSLLSIADLHRRTVATRSASRAGGTTVATSRSYSSARS